MLTLIIVIAPYGNLRKPHNFPIPVTILSYYILHTTVPFTDNPHSATFSVVSDLLWCSASDNIAIPSSPI